MTLTLGYWQLTVTRLPARAAAHRFGTPPIVSPATTDHRIRQSVHHRAVEADQERWRAAASGEHLRRFC